MHIKSGQPDEAMQVTQASLDTMSKNILDGHVPEGFAIPSIALGKMLDCAKPTDYCESAMMTAPSIEGAFRYMPCAHEIWVI